VEFADTVEAILDRKGRQIWSVAPDATVFEAIREMALRNVGALLVMEDDRLVGVVSERDYTRKVILQDRSSRDTAVREIMTSTVVTIDPECTAEEAMRTMTEWRIRHLPIVDDDAVLGVVSIGDLVEWMLSIQQSTIEQLEGYILGRYPG
jgi:CBS domain-containing protein